MTPKINRAKTEALAKKYLKKEKFKEAIAEYTKLLTGSLEDVPVRITISDIFLSLKKKDKAVEELKKVAELYENKAMYSKSIATYKRIKRLAPEDIQSIKKLADLYQDQGILSEARKEYEDLSKILVKENQTEEAIPIFEALLKLEKDDIQSRLTLAELYEKAGDAESAVEEYNVVAEFKLNSGSLDEAEKILTKALSMKKDHTRTLENLVGVLKKMNKKKQALALVNEMLQKDKTNQKMLHLLGDLHFEAGDYERAEEVFSDILSARPSEAEATVKMGKILVQKEKYDEAFDLLIPIVDMLIKKRKEERAIGLLGIILEAKTDFLPALEKLSSIYAEKNLKKEQEVVSKLLLDEYRRKGLKEKSLSMLRELRYLCPKDVEYYVQYRDLKAELGIADETTEIDQRHVVVDEAEEILEANLAKADLYIEQGLLKNAKRILDHLKLRFPDHSKIKEKLEELRTASSDVQGEEILDRVKRADEKMDELLGKGSVPAQDELSSPQIEEEAGERVTAAEIFAETDIIPFAVPKEAKKEFFDLSEKIDEELVAIKEACLQQTRGPFMLGEKELPDIISIFTKAVEDKIDMKDFESRYYLGVAYLEQGLIDEAIKEFKLALEKKSLKMECSSLLGLCYRKKGDFQEALKWIDGALEHAEVDSEQYYILQYEAASLYEEMDQPKMALKIYKKIKKWNPEYRNVAEKLKNLGK